MTSDTTFSSDDGSIYLLYAAIALPILIIFPLVVRAISRFRLRRMSRSRTIVALYEPPKALTPAEIGYLYDASLSSREVVATVFDLEYRDIIAIDQKGNLAINTATADGQQLKSHEKFVLRLIDRGDYLSILQNLNTLNLQLFKQQVALGLAAKDLVREQFYLRVFFGALKMIRNVFFFYSALILLSTSLLFFMSPFSVGDILLVGIISLIGFTFMFGPMYVALGIALTFIYVKLDGMRWIGTQRLRRIWPDIEGYRMYIKQAQLNRLSFVSEELRIKSLERDFAYAVALRMKIDWKSRFTTGQSTIAAAEEFALHV